MLPGQSGPGPLLIRRARFNRLRYLPGGPLLFGPVADHHVRALPAVPLHHPVEARLFGRARGRCGRRRRGSASSAGLPSTSRRTASAGGRINVLYRKVRPKTVQEYFGQGRNQVRVGDQNVDAVGPENRTAGSNPGNRRKTESGKGRTQFLKTPPRKIRFKY